jgi:zinc/manganese transport system substrate-binding protein
MAGRRGSAGLLALCLAAALAGCGASGTSARIEIVASTDVYAAIAEQLVAGLPPGRVGVSSIIDDPAIDPHSYEASARNELAISRADLIVENGAGYDGFVDTLRDASGARAPVINAAALTGHAADPDFNEHVWFDFPTVETVARRVSAFLIAHDAIDATALRRNAQFFAIRMHALEARMARLRARYGGTGVAITESLPTYLLAACGLVDRTPAEFSNAIEEETDASPGVLRDTLDLFATHRVALLVYNRQTAGPQTDQVINAATEAHLPVLGLTETLPAGRTYLGWMNSIVDALAAALA